MVRPMPRLAPTPHPRTPWVLLFATLLGGCSLHRTVRFGSEPQREADVQAQGVRTVGEDALADEAFDDDGWEPLLEAPKLAEGERASDASASTTPSVPADGPPTSAEAMPDSDGPAVASVEEASAAAAEGGGDARSAVEGVSDAASTTDLDPASHPGPDGADGPDGAAAWSDPPLVSLGALCDTPLFDAAEGRLGTVVDALLDPEAGLALGLVVAPEEAGDAPLAYVPFDGVVHCADGRIVLSDEGSSALAADRLEAATAALFRGREVERFEGTIGERVVLAGREGFDAFLLMDDKNRRQRVLLAPSPVTKPAPLERGRSARLDALLTRDEDGPLLVATWIAVDDFELRLRDELGRATWARERPRGVALPPARRSPGVGVRGRAPGVRRGRRRAAERRARRGLRGRGRWPTAPRRLRGSAR